MLAIHPTSGGARLLVDVPEREVKPGKGKHAPLFKPLCPACALPLLTTPIAAGAGKPQRSAAEIGRDEVIAEVSAELSALAEKRQRPVTWSEQLVSCAERLAGLL